MCFLICKFNVDNQLFYQTREISIIPDDWEKQVRDINRLRSDYLIYHFITLYETMMQRTDLRLIIAFLRPLMYGKILEQVLVMSYKVTSRAIKGKMINQTRPLVVVSNQCEMTYDAFLSYSSCDREWVRGSLLKLLEDNGYKICYDERDFQFGRNLFQEIERAVYTSHKVLAVVTSDYLKSHWCMEEYWLTYEKYSIERSLATGYL